MNGFFSSLSGGLYDKARDGYRAARAVGNSLANLLDRPLVILVYHRVADLPSDPELLAVSPSNFRRQMHYLKEHFRILRLEENWLREKEPGVIVTFDDGYADNALEALPILEEAGVPATFFVSTAHLGTAREFWWHRLENILLREGDFPARFALDDARYGRTWQTASLEQRQALYECLNALMKRVGPQRRERWLEQLRDWAGAVGAQEGRHRMMTPEELKRLAASRWATIGAHTVTHPALSALSEAQQREEIFSSRQELENLTGLSIEVFSYPFGRKRDYNRTSVRLCREAGFTRAAANFPGQVHRWTDPYQLPRHLVRNWDEDTFAAAMKRFWTR